MSASELPDSIAATPPPDAVESPRPRRRTIGQRAGHTLKAFGSDIAYMAKAPFRLKSRGFLWIAGVAAATGVIYGYDAEILEGFHRSRGDATYDAALELGERTEPVGHMGKTGPYWVGAALLATTFQVRPVQSLCLDVIESHLISGGIRNAAKTVVGRERPFEAGRASFFRKGTSLPSGHASVVFEVATILTEHTHETPLAVRIPVALVSYGVATGVAIQRVDSRGHWPSDVFLGAASGTLIAHTVARRNRERRERDAGGAAAGDRTSLAPWIGPSGEFGVVWSRRF